MRTRLRTPYGALLAAGVLMPALLATCGSGWRSEAALREEAAAISAHASREAARLQDRSRAAASHLLAAHASLISADQALGAYLATSVGDELGLGETAAPDVASLRDILAERRAQFGFDLGMLLDADGEVLARSDSGESLQQSLAADAFVRPAIEAQASRCAVWLFERRVHSACIAPVVARGTVAGYLVLGNQLEGVAAGEASLSGADVGYWLMGARGTLRLVAASRPSVDTPARLRAARTAARSGSAAPVLLGGARPGSGPDVFQRIPIAGADAVLVRATVPGASIAAAAFAGLRRQNAQWTAALAAGGGLLALALAAALLAPLRRLARLGQETLAGTAAATAFAGRRDVLGRIATALQALGLRVREQRELADYLAGMSRAIPTGPIDTAAAPEAAGTTLRGEATCVPGSWIGSRYRVLGPLGSGGMGTVYKVHDQELDEVAALKLLHLGALQDPTQVERLKDEIRLARRITHPNVLRTFDFGEADGRAYITMECVHGVTLRHLLDRSGRPPQAAALRIVRQVVAGLEAAHAVGVLHRDIKPENVILDGNGDARLMDFGIARPVLRATEGLTLAGMVVGSPHYAPPEQLNGETVDERADVFAVGVTLYEVLAGRRPYPGRTALEVYMAQVNGEAPSPSHLVPGLDADLEKLIMRCISPRASDRFRDAQELAAALDGLRQ